MTVLGPELKVGDKAPDFEAVDNGLKAVTLATTGNGVRIFSVIPSLDTPVCDAQTKRFEEETGKLPNVSIYTFSMDLPFAQKRWCGAFGVDHVKMVSDHKTGSFGQAYGTLIKDLRILSRAIFVVDKTNTIKYVEAHHWIGRVEHHDFAAKSLHTVVKHHRCNLCRRIEADERSPIAQRGRYDVARCLKAA